MSHYEVGRVSSIQNHSNNVKRMTCYMVVFKKLAESDEKKEGISQERKRGDELSNRKSHVLQENGGLTES